MLLMQACSGNWKDGCWSCLVCAHACVFCAEAVTLAPELRAEQRQSSAVHQRYGLGLKLITRLSKRLGIQNVLTPGCRRCCERLTLVALRMQSGYLSAGLCWP